MPPVIAWVKQEHGTPKILAIFDELSVSTGTINHDTYPEFEQLVGRSAAEAALGRYYREIEEGH